MQLTGASQGRQMVDNGSFTWLPSVVVLLVIIFKVVKLGFPDNFVRS